MANPEPRHRPSLAQLSATMISLKQSPEYSDQGLDESTSHAVEVDHARSAHVGLTGEEGERTTAFTEASDALSPCGAQQPCTQVVPEPQQEVAQANEAQLLPDHSSCTPKCTWQCDTPRCDEVCAPECEPPRCETRCSSPDLSGCQMECNEPHCAVVCPHSNCPSQTCAECQTTCSEPMCKLQCANDQPCHSVCEHPNCQWKCSAPTECPSPQCHMVCEQPHNCMGSTFQQIPELGPGEVSVQSFVAPGYDGLPSQGVSSDFAGLAAANSQVPVRVQSVPSALQRRVEHRTVMMPVRTKPA